jgi:hypothetical protein
VPGARAITRLLWILQLLAAVLVVRSAKSAADARQRLRASSARWNLEVIASGGGVWRARR